MLKSIILMITAISLVGCVSNSKKQDIEDIVVETAESAEDTNVAAKYGNFTVYS